MTTRRAPLFSVSLAFALGCLIGLDRWVPLRVALAAFVVIGLIWWTAARREKVSLAAFYAMTVFAGIAHTLLLASTIWPDDVRRLPEEKSFETTQWRGYLVEEPAAQLSTRLTRRSLDRTSFVLRLEAWRPTGGRLFGAAIDTPWQPAGGDIRCTLLGPTSDLQCGDRLEFAAALTPVAPALCPGELDYPAWEAASGIYYHTTISALDWHRTETGGGDWLQNLSFRARDWAYARLQLGLEDDPRIANFLAGRLIGYRQEIPPDLELDFRRTGTLHVFAVSGQSIAEMVLVMMIFLQLCGLVRWRWAWLTAPLIVLYCLLTGSPSGAIRATIMALTVLLAWWIGRPFNALACWSLALLAMLVWDPRVLLDPGAQLSFGVVLALILLSPPLLRLFAQPFAPDPLLPRELLTSAQQREEKFWHWTAAIVATTVAATLVSEPIAAVDFHQVTPIAILANMIVIPVAGLITVIGTMSVAVSLVSAQLAAWLNNTNWLVAKGLIIFVGFLAREPGASLNVPDVRALASPAPSFVVAPVQDSACLLVRTGRGAWLFNTGRETLSRAVTGHLLQFYGVNRLDGLVLAQMSGPDNGGADAIIADFRPRHLVVPVLITRSPLEKTMPELAAISGATMESWQRGQALGLGPGVRVEVLHPAADSPETLAQDRALVLLFRVGDRTLLWAGRIGPQAQADLLATYPGLHADVLIMGTEPPPSREWLDALQVREWLQIPLRNQRLNATTPPTVVAASCQVWPLDRTGAVDLHFPSGTPNQPPGILLQPWVAVPDAK